MTEHHRRAQTLIDQIPAAARVSAQDRLNPHVSGPETAYLFPRLDDVDTVFVDVTGPAWPQHPAELKAQIDGLLASDFGVAAADDGYLLLSTQAITKELPAGFFTAWTAIPAARRPASDEHAAGFARFVPRRRGLRRRTGAARLLGGRGPLRRVVVKLVWEALRPIQRDLHTYVGYLDRSSTSCTTASFSAAPAQWYPTSLWAAGRPVVVQTLPWTLAIEICVARWCL